MEKLIHEFISIWEKRGPSDAVEFFMKANGLKYRIHHQSLTSRNITFESHEGTPWIIVARDYGNPFLLITEARGGRQELADYSSKPGLRHQAGRSFG